MDKHCPICGRLVEVVAYGSNYVTIGCPEHRNFDRVIYDSVLNITEEDVWTLAESENIKIPEEKKEHVIYMVKKYLEGYCFDCAYSVWDAIKDAIKEALTTT